MAILSHRAILDKLAEGSLKIKPLDKTAIGPASIDLHLGTTFRVFKQVKEVFTVSEKADFEKISELIKVKDKFLLLPGQLAHGITKEWISLPPNLCGWIQGRSRFSRLGLMVHISSSFVQPGSRGHQVLEFNNAGSVPLSLKPGLAICQLILEEVKGEASYAGRFSEQKSP